MAGEISAILQDVVIRIASITPTTRTHGAAATFVHDPELVDIAELATRIDRRFSVQLGDEVTYEAPVGQLAEWTHLTRYVDVYLLYARGRSRLELEQRMAEDLDLVALELTRTDRYPASVVRREVATQAITRLEAGAVVALSVAVLYRPDYTGVV